MTRLAAIDIGTNSTKMTVADVDAHGQVAVLSETSDVTRLGEGVDSAKRLSNTAMDRTLKAVERFANEARTQGASAVLAAGTSALRDAANGADFIAQAKDRAGVTIEIISGDREANLAYAAVRSDPSLQLPADMPLLVFDIGGGSTELILGNANSVGEHKSLDIGAVRLTERFFTSDPPATKEIQRARDYADTLFATFDAPKSALHAAGIGGTAVNIAAVTLAATTHNPRPDVHGATLSRTDVDTALSLFQRFPLAERRVIPGLEPERADVIIAGALLLSRLLARFDAPSLVVSVRGLRYGLLADYAAHNP